MARFAIALFVLALVMALLTLQANAYAHPVMCGISGCGPVGAQGFHPPPQDPFVRFLMPMLALIGLIAFISSRVFGVLVLIKNRARKIAC
jgi:hypothetical protein